MTVARLITTRLEQLSMAPPQLRNELIRKGVHVSRQTVHAWCTNTQRPSPEHIVALWEVLVVPLDERAGWMTALTAPLERRASNRPPEPEAA